NGPWRPGALAAVIGDLGGYWAHRPSHTIPFLWRFHALHHSPSKLYFINTGRLHPIDSIEGVLMIAPILILLGATEEVMLWQIAFTNYVGLLSHCNIEMRFGFLNYLFNTPGVHRWHHSWLSKEADNNYGENIMFTISSSGHTSTPTDRRPWTSASMRKCPKDSSPNSSPRSTSQNSKKKAPAYARSKDRERGTPSRAKRETRSACRLNPP
ncbi:MAG: sterol desaturase family protein, partial [Candidatus Hydrogenedentes bacterium]|nr:sterol desaturase family protein [Candidatus Hydrogenedentota bacterium]